MPDLFDPATVFSRIRNWSHSGIGMISHGTLVYQMGGRPGIDPFGWRRERVDTAANALLAEGSIRIGGTLTSEYVVTDQGIEKYEARP